MSALSIKSQIIARLLALAEPLKKSDFGFREIERKTTPFFLAAVKPAIHVIIFPEDVIEQDARGYTIEFHALFKLIIEDQRDAYALADRATGFLQEKIESDTQLSGLASKLEYASDQPFTEEALKPAGGNSLMYLINYRRLRTNPYTLY